MRLAVVGLGLRGRLFAELAARHADVEVIGGYDPSPGARETFTRQLGVPATDQLDALTAEAPDAIVVAPPDPYHLEPALAALESGARVLLEKPLATTTADAVLIRDAARAHGDRLTVAFMNRWHPAFASVLARTAAGELGRVLFRNARLNNSVRVPFEMLSWAAQSSPGWFLMPHTVDLIAATAPAGRTRVVATGHRGLLAARGVDTWDGLQALLSFEDGTSASVESLWALPADYPSLVRFDAEFVGERGTATVADSQQGLTFYADRPSYPRVLVDDVAGRPAGPNALMLDAFLDSVRLNRPQGPTAQQGLWVTQLVEAIHQAAESHVPVDVVPL